MHVLRRLVTAGTALALGAAMLNGPAHAADPDVLDVSFGGSFSSGNSYTAATGEVMGGTLTRRTGSESLDPERGLVLNGAADTSVTAEQIVAFGKEMDGVGADWQFVNFSGARHCFTQPENANADPGNNCQYHERSSRRAFEMLRDFFRERFAAK